MAASVTGSNLAAHSAKGIHSRVSYVEWKRGKVMSIKMTFANVKQLDTAIDQIIVGAKNQREMIQCIAVGIVAHAAGKGSGNVTRAKKLVDGLGNGVRCDSLVAWFAKVGINFDEDGEVTLDKSMLTSANFSEAKKVMWCDVKKATPYKGFDFKDALVKQLKSAYKAAADAQQDDKKDKVHMSNEELTALENFVRSQVGDGNMPTKPDAIKKNNGSVTAIAK